MSMASVAEPPLPSASSVPPRANTAAQRGRRGREQRPRPSPTVCSRSALDLPAFIATESRTSASTASRSVSLSLRNG